LNFAASALSLSDMDAGSLSDKSPMAANVVADEAGDGGVESDVVDDGELILWTVFCVIEVGGMRSGEDPGRQIYNGDKQSWRK
jgi:hypothetical protein